MDSRLDGAFDVEELNDIAAVAYKCVSRISRKRPSMRDVVQALSRIVKLRHSRKSNSRRLLSTVVDDESTDLEAYDHQSTAPEHRREESIDSISDLPDV